MASVVSFPAKAVVGETIVSRQPPELVAKIGQRSVGILSSTVTPTITSTGSHFFGSLVAEDAARRAEDTLQKVQGVKIQVDDVLKDVINHESGAESAKTDAETAASNAQSEVQKAKDWATKPEDSEVETGLFSALHYAAKASDQTALATQAQAKADASAQRAEAAGASVAGAFVLGNDWNPAVGSFPAKPTVNTIWYVSNDSAAPIGGVDWHDGEYLVYSPASDRYSKLTGSPVGGGAGSQPFETPDDIFLNPKHAIRFKANASDTDPAFALGQDVTDAGVKRLILGDITQSQQQWLEFWTYDADRLIAVEQTDSKFVPTVKYNILTTKNAYDKAGVAANFVGKAGDQEMTGALTIRENTVNPIVTLHQNADAFPVGIYNFSTGAADVGEYPSYSTILGVNQNPTSRHFQLLVDHDGNMKIRAADTNAGAPNYFYAWADILTTSNLPSATTLGALPITGGDLTGDISVNGDKVVTEATEAYSKSFDMPVATQAQYTVGQMRGLKEGAGYRLPVITQDAGNGVDKTFADVSKVGMSVNNIQDGFVEKVSEHVYMLVLREHEVGTKALDHKVYYLTIDDAEDGAALIGSKTPLKFDQLGGRVEDAIGKLSNFPATSTIADKLHQLDVLEAEIRQKPDDSEGTISVGANKRLTTAVDLSDGNEHKLKFVGVTGGDFADLDGDNSPLFMIGSGGLGFAGLTVHSGAQMAAHDVSHYVRDEAVVKLQFDTSTQRLMFLGVDNPKTKNAKSAEDLGLVTTSGDQHVKGTKTFESHIDLANGASLRTDFTDDSGSYRTTGEIFKATSGDDGVLEVGTSKADMNLYYKDSVTVIDKDDNEYKVFHEGFAPYELAAPNRAAATDFKTENHFAPYVTGSSSTGFPSDFGSGVFMPRQSTTLQGWSLFNAFDGDLHFGKQRTDGSGFAWSKVLTESNTPKITTSATAPSSPKAGDLWIKP